MDVEAFQSSIQIAVAVAVLVAPALFLASLAVGAFVLGSRGRLGPIGTAVVSFTGGLTLGALLLVDVDLLVRLPIVLLLGAVLVGRWRAARRWQAGWLTVGAALPWTIVYGLIAAAMLTGGISYDAVETLGFLALGLVPLIAGFVVIQRGDPPPAEPRMDARAGQPGSREIGTINHAIREPSFLGPFGLQEVAMLVAIVAALLVVPFVVRDLPAILRIPIVAGVAALVGTEAYIRVMTPRSRRAFEAFSWLGEWELSRAKAAVGGLPLDRDSAISWLVAHPLRPIPAPNELPVRVEIELLAVRRDEARALLDLLPTDTPWERFELAALSDLVDWRAGGDGDLEGMERAAREIVPAGGEDRLRAEVTIAVAKVRRHMADGRASAGDAAGPLIEVREQLGEQADGQVGRALRRRLLPILFIVGLILTTAGEVFALPL